MNRNMWKTTIREIRQSLGRYLAIFAITALGVGFFAGLKVTGQAMREVTDKYLKDHEMYDFRLISTIGLTDEDVSSFEAMSTVENVYGAYQADAVVSDGSREYVVRFHSLDSSVNIPEISSGRLPERSGELLGDARYYSESSIGQTVRLASSNTADTLDSFSRQDFTIVGLAYSPLYLNYERGTSSVGNGSITYFYYILPEDFDIEAYTDIYLALKQKEFIYSDEYNDMTDSLKPAFEDAVEERALIRYNGLYSDAEKELGDAEDELNDAEKKLSDARKELEDARLEIADKEKELEDARLEIADKEAELADGERKISENESKLEAAEKEIRNNEDRLKEAESTILDNETRLDEADDKLALGKEELDKASAMIAENEQTLALAAEELAAKETELTAAETELDNYSAMLHTGIPGAGYSEEELAGIMSELEMRRTQIEEGKAALAAGKAQYGEGLLKLAAGRGEYEEKLAEYESAAAEVEAGRTELENARAELEKGRRELKTARKEVEEGRRELEDAKAELEDGRQKLADARAEIADGEIKLADGRQELEDGEAELIEKEAELADAKQKVADAKEELADFKEPSTYVLTRKENIGYSCFENDSTIVDGIAVVFPVFFFLVAALVCVTTMSRMIEEQRTQIGVLKALGYGEASIMSKYMIYSGSASVMGCIGGFFAGCYAFPRIIWIVYGLMYGFTDIEFIFNPVLFIISLIVALLCSVGTTYISCKHDLHQKAAELIRPRAPKNGKRIFLEKITFLWRRIPFLHKVSIRNIFRYKGRFIMMLLGIGGCTGLIITGYGIRDSISEIADEQYTQILVYDEMINFSEQMDPVSLKSFESGFKDSISSFMPVCQTSVDPVGTGSIRSVTMITFAHEDNWTDVIRLHDGSGRQLAFPGPGEVILSQNVAKINKVSIGDKITFRDSDFNEYNLTVSGICENFFNAYAYINADTYVSSVSGDTFENDPPYKSAVVNIVEGTDLHEAAASFMNHDMVSAVNVNADTLEMFSKMMEAMNYIVLLVLFCAAALAFIVLYNLTNINITERIREIATIKVLGFYPFETASYVFRENLALTAMGALVGIPVGIWLHSYVMSNIKIDMVTFDVHINTPSFVYSLLFTFAFAIFVDLVMFFKLKNINMAESLKSIE